MRPAARGGTAIEYGAAFTGIFFLFALTVGMFLSAIDPAFEVRGLPPMWVGGFLPLVALVAAARQFRAWEHGTPASRLLDPIRSRLGLRTLPTLAWFFAATLPIVGLFVLRNATMTSSSLGLDAIDQLFVLGAFLASMTLEVVLCRRSDRRDRDAGVVGSPTPAGVAMVTAGERISPLHRRISWILPVLGGVTSMIGLVLSALSVEGTGAFLPLSVGLLVAWVVHSQIVIRPHLRRIERDERAKAEGERPS